ncbi:Arylsulfatase [Maioricimonas rarisocia]|uniref:Arylsulfatase n=1 Tax=Maioricimonas rarisocia TaxID=2528026 RepID=A0A517Z733_9PLAN|nr:arylsulfatase [Maioricimonas rarisocia]QDU38295.1 Arylsulfatase [Maioricimonas rarisocia]
MRCPRLRLTLLPAVALVATLTPLPAPAADKPNIVFVMADDLGYGDLGCYGQQKIQTPNIDRLAAEGMKFTDFYAGSTVCAPSRCVLMTGLHTGHCFIRGNGKFNLRPGDVTVAEVVKKAGYTSGMFGKWGLGQENTSGLPAIQGFKSFFGYLDQTHAHNYYPSFLVRNGKRVALSNVVPDEGKYGQGVASEKNEYSHDLIFADALEFIDQNADGPFFLYLPVTIPHANNQAGKEGMEVPDYGQYADRDWPEPQKGTAAMITRLDADMGRLIEKLDEHGLSENTIVFFTSDNGPHREGGNNPDFFDSNGPLRGIKRDLYEGGIRVPMIAYWPGKVPAGTVTDEIGYHGDLMATAADLAGVEPPRGLDSISLVPTLLGNSENQEHHDALYWEFYERGFLQAVRKGDWKCVRRNREKVELYRLSEDIGEEHNIADDHPDVVAEMVSIMEREHVPSSLWKPRGKKQ